MVTEPEKTISPEQFMRLFLRSEREIFRYVAALVPNLQDAQDIVQETAVALWKKIDHYDPDRSFTAWACRFALLEARQHARHRERWPAVLDSELVDRLIERRSQLADRLDQRREYLAECLAKLSGEHRKIIERYYYDRMPVETIATRLGRTKEAIYKTLQRVRRALSDCVDREFRTEGAAP